MCPAPGCTLCNPREHVGCSGCLPMYPQEDGFRQISKCTRQSELTRPIWQLHSRNEVGLTPPNYKFEGVRKFLIFSSPKKLYFFSQKKHRKSQKNIPSLVSTGPEAHFSEEGGLVVEKFDIPSKLNNPHQIFKKHYQSLWSFPRFKAGGSPI